MFALKYRPGMATGGEGPCGGSDFLSLSRNRIIGSVMCTNGSMRQCVISSGRMSSAFVESDSFSERAYRTS